MMAPPDTDVGGRYGGVSLPSLDGGAGLGDAVVTALRERVTILPFHAEWIRRTFADDVQVSALSVSRGNAKSWIGAQLAGLALRPGSPLWQSRVEVLAVSASIEQSRIFLNFVRESLADVEDDYAITATTAQRLAIRHKATDTRLRVLSSNAKRAMGLANFSTIYADEPGAWEVRGGALMQTALEQSLGKRAGQRLIMIGTRSPAEDGTWWPELLDAGSGPGKVVTVLSAPAGEQWDSWPVIERVNPLIAVNPHLRKTIAREVAEARKNPTKRATFEAYRLNRAVDVYREALVSVEDWIEVERREVRPRKGKPIVGLDMGAERSWSAAWAIWPNGRSEVFAVVPGIPSLAEREKMDHVQRGMYDVLQTDGTLVVDEGVRVASPAVLVEHLQKRGIVPAVAVCDRFLLGTLKDVVGGRFPLVDRVGQWSNSTEDIAAFRQLVKDGPMSIVPASRRLIRFGMSQASIETDSSGNARLRKKRRWASRDDAIAAGILAAGALVRHLRKSNRKRWTYRGAA